MTKNSFDDEKLRTEWEKIIAESDIKEIPVKFLNSITVKLTDDEEVTFDINELKKIGLSIKDIEQKLLEYVEENDDVIDSIDFDLNVNAIASHVNSKTKGLLG